MQELVFEDISRQEVPVKVGQKSYILKEADGEATAKFRTAAARCHKLADGKSVGLDGAGELEPYLISLCLFERNGTGQDHPVGLSLIKSWPGRVITPIFEKAKSISHLDERDTVESLEKAIAGLQERLDKLQANGDAVKN